MKSLVPRGPGITLWLFQALVGKPERENKAKAHCLSPYFVHWKKEKKAHCLSPYFIHWKRERVREGGTEQLAYLCGDSS